tara:strand:+ start:117 stop:491 length:375 start_codon:yes stop_codon:yes gene_type:complete
MSRRTKRCFPVFRENSRVPVILSKVSPIEIGAISLGLFVFARGKLTKITKRHEIIHYLQWRELGFIGFLLLYPTFWLINMIRYRDGDKAYQEIPFEREAYGHEKDRGYLATRKPYAWIKYIRNA